MATESFGKSTYGFGESTGSATAQRIGGAAKAWVKTSQKMKNQGGDFQMDALKTAMGEHIKLQAGMIDREHFVDHIGKAGEHFEGGKGFSFQSGNHNVQGTLRVRPVAEGDTQGGGVSPQIKPGMIDLGFIPSTTTGPNRPTQTNTSTTGRTPLALEAPKPKTTFEAASPHIVPNTSSQVEGVVTGEHKTVDRSNAESVDSHLSGEEAAYLSIFNDRRRAATPRVDSIGMRGDAGHIRGGNRPPTAWEKIDMGFDKIRTDMMNEAERRGNIVQRNMVNRLHGVAHRLGKKLDSYDDK